MYTNYHIFPVLPIKHLVNQDSEPTTPHKLATGTKPSVSNPCVLFFACVVLKETSHADTKTINIRHQSQNCFCGIFLGIPQHQKGYLIHVPSTPKIVFCMALYLKKHFIVCLHTRQFRIQRQSLRDQQSHIFCTLHHLMKNLDIL